MCVFKNLYKKKFLCRYDKDGIIPYYSAEDFDGLICEEGSFSSDGVDVAYFVYHYGGGDKKTILFLHGMGPGHTAYLREIEYFCKKGFKVVTLDFAGSGKSGGDNAISIFEPTKNAVDLIGYLGIEDDLVVIGHSLGGFTALNVARVLPSVKRAVVLSGFIDFKAALKHFSGSNLFARAAYRYEKKRNQKYADADVLAYLKTTADKILFVASTDDEMVDFAENTGLAQSIGNENLSFIVEQGKKHTPQYLAEAVKYMRATFGEYYSLVKNKKLISLEEKKAFFKDKSLSLMTEQDEKVMEKIIGFINED